MSARELAHLMATLVLGGVLVVSAIAKLADLGAWRSQARAFGTPAVAIAVLPVVELVVGALVATQIADPVPAVIAMVLVAAFTAAIVVNLVRGRHPPCACFGAGSGRPLSWAHVARNGALLAVGIAAAVTA